MELLDSQRQKLTMADYTYSIEQLFEDQEPGMVRPYMASLISWHHKKKRQRLPLRYLIKQYSSNQVLDHIFNLSWDIDRVRQKNIYIDEEISGYDTRIGPDCERQSERAAMCLGFIFASVVLRQRIRKINIQAAPDLIYDLNPSAIRGIEIAGRATGGLTKLLRVRNSPEKYPGIFENRTVVEAYLSLWCCRPSVSHWEKVK